MLSNKSLGIAGVAMLGTVALLGTNAASAQINVSTSMGGLKYGLETLDLTDIVVDDDGNRYYRVDGGRKLANITVRLGVGGVLADVYSVTFDLSGIVLGGQRVDPRTDGPLLDSALVLAAYDATSMEVDANPTAVSPTRRLGTGPGSNSVTYFFAAGGIMHPKSELTLLVDAFAVSGAGTGSITATVKNVTLADATSDATATKAASMAGAVRVAAALRESTYSDVAGGESAIDVPTARVAHDYTSFGDSPFFPDDPKQLSDTVGAVVVDVGTTTMFKTAEDGDVTVVLETIVDDEESMVTYAGDFSFASKAFLADTDACGGGDVADDILMRGADGAVTNTMRLMPQILSDANMKYLCIMVDGDTEISPTTRYSVSVDYEVPEDANTRVYAPKGKARRLAYIALDGIRVTIPYLTTASQYNQRIVVANLSGVPVDYSMTFHPEAGVVAEAGADAMGMFAEGTTVLSVGRDDVVTIMGDRTRTAARLVIDSNSTSISVATTQVNIETGATDTVSYR